jgi:hypothetical protein
MPVRSNREKVNSVHLRCRRFFDRNAVIRNAKDIEVTPGGVNKKANTD